MIRADVQVTWYRQRFEQRLNHALEQGLRDVGQDIATDAKNSLGHRNKPSEPGETPTSYSDDLKAIRATVDPIAKRVTIAVEQRGASRVPGILEYGGIRDDGGYQEPRPFLRPALARQSQRNIPEFLEGRL